MSTAEVRHELADGLAGGVRAEVAEVAIVGLGPVGAALAALLGECGVDVIAVDPATQPAPYPRAIAADDETLRTLIRLPALADPLRLFDLGQRVEVRAGPPGVGRPITTVAFEDSPLGVPGLSFFHQPSLERALRAALTRLPSVRLRLGPRVTSVRDRPGGVSVTLDDASTITASWLIGCDGAASVVRRERGISYTGRTFTQPWIVVDIDSPQPLAHLPYFSYVLDPRRPAVNMPRPGGHRFEFMVLPGEQPAALAERSQVDRWLEPYLAPLDGQERAALRMVRTAVYAYHARTAARWRDGRVLIAGDAAHCMPPFGGQGLGAGIGDALALAWRLDEVRTGLAPPRLLDDYERERRPRIAEMTRTALVAGRLLSATTIPGAAGARLALRAADAAPVLGHRFRAGSLRARPRVPAPGSERRYAAGEPLPNPRVRTRDGCLGRLDDVLPAGWALLAKAADPWRLLSPALEAALRERHCAALAVVAPGGLGAGACGRCRCVEDLDGTLLSLLRGGPGPLVLVRPDRFLAAAGPEPALAAAFFRLTSGVHTLPAVMVKR